MNQIHLCNIIISEIHNYVKKNIQTYVIHTGLYTYHVKGEQKDEFMEKCCGVVNPCVCPYDFVKFCSEKIIRGRFLPSEAGL